jgi:hypothetical protein
MISPDPSGDVTAGPPATQPGGHICCLPSFGRLALIAEAPRPAQLKIAELRAIPSKMTFAE